MVAEAVGSTLAPSQISKQPSARTPPSSVAKPTLTKVKFAVIGESALLKEVHFRRGMFKSFVPEPNSGGIKDPAALQPTPPA